MQISRLRLISTVNVVALLAAMFSLPAHAYDQWSWTAAGQTFTSKQQAVAYMRSQSPTSRYQYYTIETLSAVTATTATYDYTAPNRDPSIGAWSYDHPWTPENYPFGDEGSAKSALLAIYPSSPECSASTLSDTSGWTTVQTAIGASSNERKYVSITKKTYSTYWMTCFDSTFPDQLYRLRPVACPTDYTAAPGGAAYCYVAGAGQVTGSLTECNECGGNPTNVSSGEKIQAETDYSGGGLQFTRTFRAQSLESPAHLGVGWTHTFARAFVLGNGSSTTQGLLRGDGSAESFQQVSTRKYSRAVRGHRLRR